MKISPVASQGIGGVSGQAVAPAAPRTFKMATNATPGLVPAPEEPSTPDGIETPAADEATQPLSPQFAELAKRRRALQVKEREIADREKALAEKSATPADSIALARLKSDPIGVFLDAGLTYDDLTAAIVARADGGGQNLKAIEDRIKSVEDGFDKKLSDRDVQAKKQALAEMQREATGLIAEGEDYALVRETRSVPKVMELIEKTYDETGEVLDVREALKLVEDEIFKDQTRLLKLQKVQAQFTPQQPAPATQQQRPQMRTLTNRDTAQVPMSAKQRALAAFNGTLRR